MRMSAKCNDKDVCSEAGHRFSAHAFLTFASAALLVVFALLFRNYRTEHFIAAGIACLLARLLTAIPPALLSSLLLRRGFAVNPISAGVYGRRTRRCERRDYAGAAMAPISRH